MGTPSVCLGAALHAGVEPDPRSPVPSLGRGVPAPPYQHQNFADSPGAAPRSLQPPGRGLGPLPTRRPAGPAGPSAPRCRPGVGSRGAPCWVAVAVAAALPCPGAPPRCGNWNCRPCLPAHRTVLGLSPKTPRKTSAHGPSPRRLRPPIPDGAGSAWWEGDRAGGRGENKIEAPSHHV